MRQFRGDFLLLGTGAALAFPSPSFRAEMDRRGLGLEAMDTGAACRTFNVLVAEGRMFTSALLAPCEYSGRLLSLSFRRLLGARWLTSDDMKQRRRDNEAAAAVVRQRDRDRYWSALFAPSAKRPGLIALYGFNAELDHILAFVSEPMAGQIRLQWWRDAVDLATPGTRTGNPVADALSAAIFEHTLPKDRLIGMVDARVPVLFGDTPADERAMKASLRETEGAVFEACGCHPWR